MQKQGSPSAIWLQSTDAQVPVPADDEVLLPLGPVEPQEGCWAQAA